MVFAIIVVAVGVALAVSFIAEREYASEREQRAGRQAASLAQHAGLLATGDAFSGYIQMLRDADDPEVRSIVVPSDVRTAALRRMLELNTSRFSSLAVVDLNGTLIAATDGTILDAPLSQAYSSVRANRGNANSDITLMEDGAARVDYATILVDPVAGQWAVLVARADAARLWQPTLAATVNGSRNVIINREGLLAAGVSSDSLGATWAASEFPAGTYRSTTLGMDGVCGLAAIARDTQIDHDWNVASCVPAANVLSAGAAPRNVALLALLTAFAAVLVGAVALAWASHSAKPPAEQEPGEEESPANNLEPAADREPALPLPAPIVVPREIGDARILIGAYEDRSARLAARVRESVQARLLVASSRVEEALTLLEEDQALATAMLERAAHELDDLNEHELRAMGQELHPDLVRLGLPAALKALRKDIADTIDLEVEADPGADSLDDDSALAIPMAHRVALYRITLDTLTELARAGIESATVHLERTPERLWLAVKGHGLAETFDETALEAGWIGILAYGGQYKVEHSHDVTEVAIEFEFGPTSEKGDVAAADDHEGVEGEDPLFEAEPVGDEAA
jgi:hypothetical protein